MDCAITRSRATEVCEDEGLFSLSSLVSELCSTSQYLMEDTSQEDTGDPKDTATPTLCEQVNTRNESAKNVTKHPKINEDLLLSLLKPKPKYFKYVIDIKHPDEMQDTSQGEQNEEKCNLEQNEKKFSLEQNEKKSNLEQNKVKSNFKKQLVKFDGMSHNNNNCDKTFKCAFCQRKFVHKYALKMHLETHKNADTIEQCQEQQKKSSKLQFEAGCSIVEKIGAQQKSQLNQCQLCNKVYAKWHDLKIHYLSHSTKRPFKCNICGKDFAQSCALKTHSRIHAGLKPYKCSICQKAFTQKSTLDTHSAVHTSQLKECCTLCNKRFKYRGSLRRHVLCVHEKVYKKFPCTIAACTTVCRSKSDLMRHLRSHTGERPFKCLYCEKRFLTTSALNVHHLIHSKREKFKCPVCDKSFASKSYAKIHQRSHLKK